MLKNQINQHRKLGLDDNPNFFYLWDIYRC
jgi:hypothetical protein